MGKIFRRSVRLRDCSTRKRLSSRCGRSRVQYATGEKEIENLIESFELHHLPPGFLVETDS